MPKVKAWGTWEVEYLPARGDILRMYILYIHNRKLAMTCSQPLA
jgi:hypothetical protein